jgi:hypothetical protein
MEEYDTIHDDLMIELGRLKCELCNCWIVNFKRHIKSKKHINNFFGGENYFEKKYIK